MSFKGQFEPAWRNLLLCPSNVPRLQDCGIAMARFRWGALHRIQHKPTFLSVLAINQNSILAALRNPDGQGFAAFGQVIEGMDVVRVIHRQPQHAQQFTPAIPILQIDEELIAR
jgi:cyclophilin family peptidyl-prolyl cis-trans isomerase